MNFQAFGPQTFDDDQFGKYLMSLGGAVTSEQTWWMAKWNRLMPSPKVGAAFYKIKWMVHRWISKRRQRRGSLPVKIILREGIMKLTLDIFD